MWINSVGIIESAILNFGYKKNGAQGNEISLCVQGLVSILQSDKDNVEDVIKDVTDKWSQSAVDYFNGHL